MGRLPSGVLLVLSLCWTGLAAEDCRVPQGTSGPIPCIDKILKNCMSELHTGGKRQLRELGLSDRFAYLVGSFEIKHAKRLQYRPMNISRSGPLEKTKIVFSWIPVIRAAITSQFWQCPAQNSDESHGCITHNGRFSFTVMKFKKISYWKAANGGTLVQQEQGNNPNATMELKDLGTVAKELSKYDGLFGNWSTERETVIRIIRKTWGADIKTMLEDTYDGWLEQCVLPALSNLITY